MPSCFTDISQRLGLKSSLSTQSCPAVGFEQQCGDHPAEEVFAGGLAICSHCVCGVQLGMHCKLLLPLQTDAEGHQGHKWLPLWQTWQRQVPPAQP